MSDQMHVLSMGVAFPEGRISNQLIEELDIGTNEEWILSKIGIRERRTSLPADYIKSSRNERPQDAVAVAQDTAESLGKEAARRAIEGAGLSPKDIGMVICNCCTPEASAPTEALRIAKGLGIEGEAYDVFTACPAFALHVDYLANFEAEELPEYVLCISTAVLTQNVNYNDRSASAIWGDGAAAWIISPRRPGRLKVLGSFFTADPLRCDAVTVDTFGHFDQDGRAVRDFSVRQTVRLLRNIEQDFQIDWHRDVFIGHQANRTMLAQITNNRKIPEENHWFNVTEIGNQAGAGAPATLCMNWDKIQKGQKIVVAVVGAGLSWGSIVFEGTGI